jgi:hypothetical protein
MDVCAVGLKKHRVFALLEADVTEARARLKKLKSGGNAVSLMGWLLSCLGSAAAAHPASHGVRTGRRTLALTGKADVTVLVEKTLDGEVAPLPFLIRDCQEKSPAAISAEIRGAQADTVPRKQRVLLERVYPSIPAFLRRAWWRRLTTRPEAMQRAMGTIAVTSLGSYGSTRGWIIPLSVYPLCVGVGALAQVAAVKGGRVVVREHLCLSVLLDHDVIDGAPAARFVSRFTRMLETAHGL